MDKSVKTNGAVGRSKNAWSPQGGIDVSLTGHPHSLGDDSWMRLFLSRDLKQQEEIQQVAASSTEVEHFVVQESDRSALYKEFTPHVAL